MPKEKIRYLAITWTAILGVLYLVKLRNYLLFHALAETVSISIAVAIFMLVWNVRRSLDNSYLLFVGIAYLFVGSLDLVHTLAYQGMGLFRRYETNLQNQLWIASRYLESLSLFAGSFLLGKKLRPILIMGVFVAATTLLLAAIFVWHIFPTCFVDGTGPTLFRKLSDFVIIAILGAAIALLVKKRIQFDPTGLQFIVASIIFTILSELCFTFFADVYGIPYFFGHFLKLLSFYCIYIAIIELGLSKPFAVLFRNLKKSEEALRLERDFVSSVLSTAGALVLITDPHGKIIGFNKACESLTKYSFEEIKGKCFWDLLLATEDTASIKSLFVQLKQDQFINNHENHWLAKDGSRYLIRWSHTVLRGADGSVEYNIVTGIDITKRRQAEENLKKSHNELEQRVKERSADLLAANEMLAKRVEELKSAEKALLDSERQLHFLSSQLLTIQEAERRRIARELHDELGGSLAVLKLRTSYIEKHLQQHQMDLKEECQQTLGLINQTFENVHRLSRDLSPSILEDIGLTSAMQWLIDNFIKLNEIKIESAIAEIDHFFTKNEKIMLFRILQEALTNISKHANARTVLIKVYELDSQFAMTIEDDGNGFDRNKASAKEFSGMGLGMATMKERARILGGSFDIWSEVGKGTRIVLRVPIKKENFVHEELPRNYS